MKRLLSIVAIAGVLTSCGGGKSEVTTGGPDSVKRAFDSVKQTGDTTALNQKTGDTVSAGAAPGAGSASGAGGAKTGGAPKKGGK